MTTFSSIRENDGLTYMYLKRYDATSGVQVASLKTGKRVVGDQTRFRFNPGLRLRKQQWNLNPVIHSKVQVVQNYPLDILLYGLKNGVPVPASIYRGSVLGFHSSILPTLQEPVGFDESWANDVLVKAQSSINSADIDVGVNIAELGSALRMMTNPIAGLASFLNKFFMKGGVRIRHPNTRAALSYLSDKWLEVRYGWIPLCSDFAKGLDSVYTHSVPFIQGERGKKVIGPTTIGPTIVNGVTLSGMNLTYSYRYTRTSYTEARAKIYFTIIDRKHFRKVKLGLDSLNFPKTVWELVPFSFAVDWFADVGSWISAITPNPAIHTLGASVSFEGTEQTTLEGNLMYSGASSSLKTPYPEVLTGTATAYQRWRLDDIPYLVPSLDWKYRNLKHVVDSLSLIHQRFKR